MQRSHWKYFHSYSKSSGHTVWKMQNYQILTNFELFLSQRCQKDLIFCNLSHAKSTAHLIIWSQKCCKKKALGDTHNNYSFAHGQIENEWLSFTLLAFDISGASLGWVNGCNGGIHNLRLQFFTCSCSTIHLNTYSFIP